MNKDALGFWNWVRQNVDLLMLGALALVVIGTWVVVELGDEVLEGEARHYDEWVLHRLRVPGDPTDPIGPTWFEGVWRDLTALGSAAVLGLVTLACAGHLLMARRYRTLIVLAVVVLGGVALTFALKSFFARPRPEFASRMTNEVTPSFPSGHSTLSTIVYLTLGVMLARTRTAFLHKVYFIGLALIVIALVGFSRVYLGVHYPTDVLAGWSTGLTWALLCWLVVYLLQKGGIIERPRDIVDR